MSAADKKYDTQKLVLTAIMTALVLVGTIALRIPVPMTQGYVHLGDAMVYLGVLMFGRRDGSIAAGLGSALGDILGGYAYWAPWSLIIKFLMAFVSGTILNHAYESEESNSEKSSRILRISGMVAGGLLMTLGYYIVEVVMYGSFAIPLAEVPWNIGQFGFGIIVSLALYAALSRVPSARNIFHK